jgi:hypothetical protein
MIELPDDVVQIAARALANSVIGTEDANWTPSDETTKHALAVLEAFLGACQAREQFRVNGTVPNSSSSLTRRWVMTTLHERLQEAVNERLRIAEAATPGPWESHGSSYYRIAPIGKPQVLAAFMRSTDAEHIAANDPARIIRECQRDLRVLERHAPILTKPMPSLVPLMCSYDWSDGDGWPTKWPCEEIKDLAEAYQIDAITQTEETNR